MSAPTPSTRIVRVDPVDRRGRRARLVLGDGSEVVVATEVLETTGLGAGDPLDEAGRARLVDADLRWRLRERALRLLGVRPRSRFELRVRLLRDGSPSAAVDACLDALAGRGLLDDEAFARAFVRDRLRLRPRGRRRLLGELRGRGVDGHVAERAVDEVFAEEGAKEEELARAAAESWLRRQPAAVGRALAAPGRSPERERARRRLHGYLARRGFVGETARRALEALEAGT